MRVLRVAAVLVAMAAAVPAMADDSSRPACASAKVCPCRPMHAAAASSAAEAQRAPAEQNTAPTVSVSPGSDASSQSNSSMSAGMGAMPGMSMGAIRMGAPSTFISAIVNHASAGTSAEPLSTPHEMLMTHKGAWMLMLHGEAFVASQQQTGPRGADKVFSTSWFMPMAQRELGPGTLTLRGMFSLEPATISERQYPELFQVGETAYGKPIVDGQHPHNFFMELAAIYDWKIGSNSLVSFYAAPVGDPAMGPEAFPHRVSASEDTLAPLGHHLQDSTHISYDVMTLGYTYKIARVEFSGFHGGEPGENRWIISTGDVDSWSARLTVNPGANWSAQYSIGRLHAPEALEPGEDQLRMTTSVTYNRPIARGGDASWGNSATTLIWGRNLMLPGGAVYNSYLAESTLKFLRHNYAWTRIENVDRSNELLIGENPLPPGYDEKFLARIQAYSFGYDREFPFIPHFSSALGAQVTLYGKPAFLDSLYGEHPLGVLVFVRFRPTPSATK
jgi:hypothetical protein